MSGKKAFIVIAILSLLLITVFTVSCGKNTGDKQGDTKENRRTREYFETLDKESSLDDIVEDIGPYGITGSGILYHTWKLDDGSEAHLVFNSKGKIEMIYIVGDDKSERIYKRDYH